MATLRKKLREFNLNESALCQEIEYSKDEPPESIRSTVNPFVAEETRTQMMKQHRQALHLEKQKLLDKAREEENKRQQLREEQCPEIWNLLLQMDKDLRKSRQSENKMLAVLHEFEEMRKMEGSQMKQNLEDMQRLTSKIFKKSEKVIQVARMKGEELHKEIKVEISCMQNDVMTTTKDVLLQNVQEVLGSILHGSWNK